MTLAVAVLRLSFGQKKTRTAVVDQAAERFTWRARTAPMGERSDEKPDPPWRNRRRTRHRDAGRGLRGWGRRRRRCRERDHRMDRRHAARPRGRHPEDHRPVHAADRDPRQAGRGRGGPVQPDADGLGRGRRPARRDRLDPALGAGTWNQSALQLTRDGDRQLSVPSEAWSQLLYYRRDLFQAAGLPAPTTYDAILNAARTLHTPQRAGFVGATAPGDAFTEQTFEHIALANGCEMVDAAGTITMDSPQCVAAFDFYG